MAVAADGGLKEVKRSACCCNKMRVSTVSRACFGCANADEAVLAAGFAWLLLSLAHAVVIDVEYDPVFTLPRSTQGDASDCAIRFVSVDVEHPNQVPLRAEMRPAPRLELSPSAEDEIFIGSAIAVTDVSLTASSGRSTLTDDYKYSRLTSVGVGIGKLIVVMCYRHVELPTAGVSPASHDFTCLSTLTDAFVLDCHDDATESACSVRIQVDLAFPRNRMLLREHSMYQFHVYTESQENCSDTSAAASPARLFRFVGAQKLMAAEAVPDEEQAVDVSCDCPNNAGPCVTYPRDGSMLVRDRSRLIIDFDGTESLRSSNTHAFMVLNCIAFEDVFYRVYLNGRLLKSFNAKSFEFEHGACAT